MSAVQSFPPQQKPNPMLYAGLFSSCVAGLLGLTIVIIAYTKRCDNVQGQITKRECCKQTWERFSSSVPLTIFIVSLVIFFLALAFIYFGRSRT